MPEKQIHPKHCTGDCPEEMILEKAVIYARYSSDNQRDASIDQQVKACEKYALEKDLQILRVYDDRALTGKTYCGRLTYTRCRAGNYYFFTCKIKRIPHIKTSSDIFPFGIKIVGKDHRQHIRAVYLK